MLTRERLVELYRGFHDADVLSVYIDAEGSDPGDRRVWAKEVERRLGDEEVRLRRDHGEAVDGFGRARARVAERLEKHQAFLPGRGYVLFATPDEVFHEASLSVPMPNLVRWEKGLRVAPYVRGLKQDRSVVTVLADRRRARVFTYRHGVLEEHEDLIREPIDEDIAEMNMSKRASTHSGVRGKTSADAARDAMEAHAARLQGQVSDVVGDLADGEAFIVLGGTNEAVTALAKRLSAFGDRILERPSMHFEMSDSEILEAVEEAASELTRRAQDGMLTSVLDLARSGGNGRLGVQPTIDALLARSVDTLLLTRAFREREPDLADHCVGTAFEQNAAVEELSGSAAERLEAEGGGLAARLRFRVPA